MYHYVCELLIHYSVGADRWQTWS